MNPEVKQDNRKKLRWLMLGHLMKRVWDPKLGMYAERTDSPTAKIAATRQLILSEEPGGDGDDPWVVASVDADQAFLQALVFNEKDGKRYVGWMPFKGAELLVFEQLGVIYGECEAPLRWHETLQPAMERLGYTPGQNDPCVYKREWDSEADGKHEAGDKGYVEWRGSEIIVRVSTHVDDLLVKGRSSKVKQFFEELKGEFLMKPPVYLGVGKPL